MKIINEGFPKGDQILLDSITMTYIQESDCTESSDNYQEVTISTRDGGGGKFLHIKTEGWSITDVDELKDVINDFYNRIGLNESSNNT